MRVWILCGSPIYSVHPTRQHSKYIHMYCCMCTCTKTLGQAYSCQTSTWNTTLKPKTGKRLPLDLDCISSCWYCSLSKKLQYFKVWVQPGQLRNLFSLSRDCNLDLLEWVSCLITPHSFNHAMDKIKKQNFKLMPATCCIQLLRQIGRGIGRTTLLVPSFLKTLTLG